MIYKLKKTEEFNVIACCGDYVCNRGEFEKALARSPEFFGDWKEVIGQSGAFTVEITKLIDSPSVKILKNTLAGSNSKDFTSSIYDEKDKLLVGYTEIDVQRELTKI